MLGRIAKYQRDWPASRHHSLCALSLHEDPADAETARWNAALAATALGDREDAWRHWSACGLSLIHI